MFDFQNLDVYRKAHYLNVHIQPILKLRELDRIYKDQFRRAAFSISLNIAEGSGRFSKADRKNFLIIARSSSYECAAIIDHLTALNFINQAVKENLLNLLEEISKMLYRMIRNLE